MACTQSSSQASTEHGPRFRVAGSDTEVNLVQGLLEAYRESAPNFLLSVSGGGSGAGIAALLDGQIEVANSSRDLKASELTRAAERGTELGHIVFAIDALALVVHPNNPVQSLSLEQIGALYRGTIQNWREVGGPDLKVSLYGRQSSSGTFTYFRGAVVNDDYSPSMMSLTGNAQIVEAVRADPGGLGYVSAGYARRRVEQHEVAAIAIPAGNGTTSPVVTEDVALGRYPLSRPLYQFFRKPLPSELARFLGFVYTQRGLDVLTHHGFFPPAESHRQQAEAALRLPPTHVSELKDLPVHP